MGRDGDDRNSVYEPRALDALAFGTVGGKEKSSETDSRNTSDEAIKLKKVIGIPSICANTQTQRKRIIYIGIIIRCGIFISFIASIQCTAAPDPDHLMKYGRRSRGFFAAASGLIHLQPELAISGDEIIYRTDNRDGSLLHQATRQTLFGISLMTNNIFRLVIDASLALSSLTSSPAIICSPCAVSVS
jgi:hypothetical protein